MLANWDIHILLGYIDMLGTFEFIVADGFSIRIFNFLDDDYYVYYVKYTQTNLQNLRGIV